MTPSLCTVTEQLVSIMVCVWYIIVMSLYMVIQCQASQQRIVSMYGESYLHLPVTMRDLEWRLCLQFKGHNSHGLLFLATDGLHSFDLQLQSGHVHVTVDGPHSDVITLISHQDTRFDDLQWHDIEVKLTTSNISLHVDNATTFLDTHGGIMTEIANVFIGGMDRSLQYFYIHYPGFRGCMKNVMLNDVDVINKVESLKNKDYTKNVDWRCDKMFGESINEPISFLSYSSFVQFPLVHMKDNITLQFGLKTRTYNAFILYINTQKRRKYFLSVQLVRGRLKVVVRKGRDFIAKLSQLTISDGILHTVRIQINNSMVEVIIDTGMQVYRFDHSDRVDCKGHLHFGALSQRVLAKQLINTPEYHKMRYNSIIGCIQNITVNSRMYTFANMTASQHISAGCVWTYGCNLRSCDTGMMCVEGGIHNDDAVCLPCDSQLKKNLCNNGIAAYNYSSVLSFRTLHVPEGGQAMLTMSNINMNLHGMSSSDVVMSVASGPHHGSFLVSVTTKNFTMADIHRGRLVYTHDGSETLIDDITIKATITYDKPHFIELYRILKIYIKPKNDVPKIYLPLNNTINILQDTKLKITSKLLRAIDSDSSTSDLTFTIGSTPASGGYFVTGSNHRRPVTSFTQDDVDNGLLWFVHEGAIQSHFTLILSDGQSKSPVTNLTILAAKITTHLVTNTGIVVVYKSWVYISRANLSSVANDNNQDVELTYLIKESPRFGEIQIRRSSRWLKVDRFRQSDVNNGFVRYIQTTGESSDCCDWFVFTMMVLTTESSPAQFLINCIPLEVSASDSVVVLNFNGAYTISSHDIDLHVNSKTFDRNNVFIEMTKPLVYGTLNRGGIEIGENSQFALSDVNHGMVSYKLNDNIVTGTEEMIYFKAVIPDVKSITFTLKIIYNPNSGHLLVNNGLHNVIEGQTKVITKRDLYVTNSQNVRYDIIDVPKHGVLCLVYPHSMKYREQNIASFTNADIDSESLIYQHDDSENSQDSFTFSTSGEKDIQTEVTFTIFITLRNDNEPVRLVDTTFTVVTGKERVVSIRDLQYRDPDIDYDAGKLLYSWGGLTIGEIIHASTGDKLTHFTQNDLINEKVVFRHTNTHGLNERLQLEVSDGKYTVVDWWHIVASDPFIRVDNNTGLYLAKGDHILISTHNLSIVTNTDLRHHDIVIDITTQPTHGFITLKETPTDTFMYQDLESSIVLYQHDDSAFLDDLFTAEISVFDTSVTVTIPISIVDERFTQSPHVVNNNVLKIDQGESTIISSQYLATSHDNTPATDIVYIITSPPQFGHLQIQSTSPRKSDISALKFTQDDIDSGYVTYTPQSHSISDKFTFSVDNDYASLKHLDFYIEITSKQIELHSRNISVTEGQRSRLQPIQITGQYSDNSRDVTFNIISQPKHGTIKDQSNSDSIVSQFTYDSQRFLYYAHDNSETTHDSFTIIARLNNVTSKPMTIYIIILPIDDVPPKVLKNHALLVWKGSISLLSNSSLQSRDTDSPLSAIVYRISQPTNGHVSLISNTFRPIRSFTQKLIDDGKIAFVHNGVANGFFTFQVTDGKNSDALHRFSIIARPLILTFDKRSSLQCYPNSSKMIDTKYLLASTNDISKSRVIVYHVTRTPEWGRIVSTAQRRTREVNSFTQFEVTSGLIHYQHTGHMSGWSRDDYFNFEVTTIYAEPIVNQVFMIQVSYSYLDHENQKSLITLKSVSVLEGRKIVIQKIHLDIADYVAQLRKINPNVIVHYKLSLMPISGDLLLVEDLLILGDTFTQEDINNNKLKYLHDDSNTEEDSFRFILVITSPRSSSHNITIHDSMNISVISMNDEPFVLVTKYPTLTVVQGRSMNITSADLLVQDADTSPEDIVYTLTKGPSYGHIALADDLDTGITTFTQTDIDEKWVLYVHRGSKQNDSFLFKVTDGAFEPLYEEFLINVIPLYINVSVVRTVNITQGKFSIALGEDVISVVSNGRLDDINYNITAHPRYGRIKVNSNVVSSFTHSQLTNNLVTFVQTDMKSPRDHFEFYGFLHMFVTPPCVVQFVVIPLVLQHPLKAPMGSRVAITVLELDASDLSAITGDNPSYTVTSPPQFGSLVRTSSMKRDLAKSLIDHLKYRQVSKFSHEDVIYGKLFYVSNKHVNTSSDSFSYILSAYNVQPAGGTFMIKLESPDIYDSGLDVDFTPLHPTAFPVSPTNKTHPTLQNTNDNNTALVTGIVCSLSLLAIAVIIIIIIFLWRRRHSQSYHPPKSPVIKVRPMISGPLHLVNIEERENHIVDDEHAVFLELDAPTSGIPIRIGDAMNVYENVGECRAQIPQEIYQNVNNGLVPEHGMDDVANTPQSPTSHDNNPLPRPLIADGIPAIDNVEPDKQEHDFKTISKSASNLTDTGSLPKELPKSESKTSIKDRPKIPPPSLDVALAKKSAEMKFQEQNQHTSKSVAVPKTSSLDRKTALKDDKDFGINSTNNTKVHSKVINPKPPKVYNPTLANSPSTHSIAIEKDAPNTQYTVPSKLTVTAPLATNEESPSPPDDLTSLDSHYAVIKDDPVSKSKMSTHDVNKTPHNVNKPPHKSSLNKSPSKDVIPVCKVTPLVSTKEEEETDLESKSDEHSNISLNLQSIDEDWTLFDSEMMSHLNIDAKP